LNCLAGSQQDKTNGKAEGYQKDCNLIVGFTQSKGDHPMHLRLEAFFKGCYTQA
jgi:hypothetical protein